ncbi:MAG: hypothetical protein PWQ18_452 [Clostridia bacterium]|nr:hypothetical protein [Clostridia bacterium]
MATDLARAVELINRGEVLAASSILETARTSGEEIPLAPIITCSQGFLIHGSPGQAITWLERAVRMAAGLDDPVVLMEVMGWLGLACLEAGLEDKATAIQETTRREDCLAAPGLLLFRARWLVTRGEREAAGDLYNIALAQKRLTTAQTVTLLLERSRWHYAGGDLAAAGRDWQRAEQLAGLLGNPLLLAWCRQVARGGGQLGQEPGRQKGALPPRLYFRLLGEFSVWRGEEMLAVSSWPRRKVVALLQYLALQPHWLVARDKVVELFWGEDGGSNVLHVTIHTLRKALTAGLVPAPAYLAVQNGLIGLKPELVNGTDLQQFRACLQAARVHWESDRPRALECYRQARSFYSGELLAGVAEESWLAPLRENTRQMYVEALVRLAAAGNSQDGAALSLWLEVLELELGHEEARQQAITLLAKSGRKDKALACYQHYARYLARELGLPPAPALEKLYRQLKAGMGGERDGS